MLATRLNRESAPQLRITTGRIVSIYALLTTLWVFCSDRLLLLLAPQSTTLSWMGTLKGLAFVLFTSVVLHAVFTRVQWLQAQGEARYRRLAEQAPDIIYRYRLLPTPHLEYISPAVTSILGYTPEEHYADPLLSSRLIHVDDQARFAALLAGQLPSEPLLLRWHHRNGQCVWTEQRNVPIYEHGLLVAIEGIARDVSERQQSAERLRRLAGLHSVDQMIAASLDTHLTLATIVEQAIAQLGVDAADVLLLDAQHHQLVYRAGYGFRTATVIESQVQLGEGLLGEALLARRPVRLPVIPAYNETFTRGGLLEAEGFVAYYALPLIAKGQIKGVLELFHRAPLEPDVEWLHFMETLAGQAAIALDNAELVDRLQQANNELERAYDSTLEGWARALELRDSETEGHSRRVTALTEHLARVLGVPDEQLIHVRRGALLHDIGKMALPDAILHKPGPLDELEWVIMRRHPVDAYNLLAPIAYLQPALDIPYAHHERWDGSGYPRGLAGPAIPLAARIFAVVDVWDALTNARCYKTAWPAERARAFICEQSGRHFDPMVVEAFMRVLTEQEPLPPEHYERVSQLLGSRQQVTAAMHSDA